MGHKKVFVILIIGLFILTACGGKNTSQVNIDQIVELTAQAVIATKSVALTPVVPTEAPVSIETPTVQVTEPQPTPVNAVITITGIQQTDFGRAIVSWDAIGDFPYGFKLVWTTEQRYPSFPDDPSSFASDPNARSAMFAGAPGSIYYLRVCRFTGITCDVYSDLGIFAFNPSEKTATSVAVNKTVVPTKVVSGGGGGSSGATLTPVPTVKIVKVTGGSSGKAYMEWTSDTNPTKGWKILYSTTNSLPVLGKDSYYVVSSNTARSAYVDGKSNTKYYYRICKYNGSTCEYSQVYTFTFPTFASTPTKTATTDTATISITSINNLAAGSATINWDATGTFSSGFKILSSTTNSTPTLGGAGVTAILVDGSLRAAVVNGVPRGHYYYRICKYTGSACSVYSNVYEFTYADISEDATISFAVDGAFSEPGKVKLNWDIPAGDNAGGYLILQAYPDTPIFPEAVKYTVSNPGARTFTVQGLTSGMTYNFRLCLYNGTICTAYSEVAPDVVVP